MNHAGRRKQVTFRLRPTLKSKRWVSGNLPVSFEKGYPAVDDCFNTPTTFHVKYLFENGVEMILRHDTDNGILFEGEKGRFFVNRGKLVGTPTEWLKPTETARNAGSWNTRPRAPA